jgi:arylsulfatase A-like enzyme
VPLVAPQSYFEPYPHSRMELAEVVKDDLKDIPKAGLPIWREGNLGMTEPEKRRKALSGYYAAVSFMDAQVGRVLKALDELKLTDRTIVVFISDHGWHLGEHTFWQKMSLHEESARVPLIIAGPGIEPAVTRSFAELVDLYPTLSDLAGLDVPKQCSGHSLAPVLRDPNATVRDAAYCTKRPGTHLIRTDRWAYMDYGDQGRELYDMHEDPRQYTNLADDPKYAPVVERMQRILKDKLESMQR